MSGSKLILFPFFFFSGVPRPKNGSKCHLCFSIPHKFELTSFPNLKMFPTRAGVLAFLHSHFQAPSFPPCLSKKKCKPMTINYHAYVILKEFPFMTTNTRIQSQQEISLIADGTSRALKEINKA